MQSLWVFYWRLVCRLPAILFSATDLMLTATAIALFFLALFNPELTRAIVKESEGISRWWALIPLSLLFCWGLMRANYERFQVLESELKQFRGRATSIDRARNEADKYAALLHKGDRILVKWRAGYIKYRSVANRWRKEAFIELEQNYGHAVAERFNLAAVAWHLGFFLQRREHEARLKNLASIIEEIRTGKIVSKSPM